MSSSLTIVVLFPFCSADAWLSAAVDCLEFLPDELVVEVSRGLAKCPEETTQYKRLLYSILIQHYGQTDYPPLFSNHIFDIHSGVSELLGKTGRGGLLVGASFSIFLNMPAPIWGENVH